MSDEFAHLSNRNSRQAANEQEEQRSEKAQAAEQGGVVPECRGITAPGGRNEITREANHDDDETLEPHSRIDDQREDEQGGHAGAHFTNPEELRTEDVAQNQRVVEGRIGTV